jgi:hypothetical protein
MSFKSLMVTLWKPWSKLQGVLGESLRVSLGTPLGKETQAKPGYEKGFHKDIPPPPFVG